MVSPKAPPAPLADLVNALGSDTSLTIFLSPEFSPESHVGTAVRQNRISPALEDARRASSLLTANVRQEVIRRKDALLAEVEAVDALEKEVATVSNGVSSLTTVTNALAEALHKPYVPMERAVQRMKNLSAAMDLVRGLHRFRVCTTKLAEAGLISGIGGGGAVKPEMLPAAAAALKEVEELIGVNGVAGLDKVEGVAKEIIAVRKASPELRKRAAAVLKNGLADRAQVDVEAAALAFNELGVLQERVNGEVARMLRETQTIVHRGLEAPAGSPLAAMRGSARDKGGKAGGLDVWSKIESMLTAVGEACCKAILLQQVLSRKYCDKTHMSLLHDTVASNFIDAVSRTLAEQVGVLSRTRLQRPAAAYVFLALAEGYPKLKSLLTSLATRVSALARVSPTPITRIGATAKLPLIPDHDFIQSSFFHAVEDVETHYLTASLERLTATVSGLFAEGKYAGETDALTLTKALAAELTAARGDKQLFQTAVSNVSTALRLCTSHAEDYAAATAPDEEPNGSALGEVEEWRLTGLYNGMVTLSLSASRVLGEREDGSGPIPAPIAKELSTLSRFCDLLLDGPFSTCRRNIETVLQRMHTEDLAGEVGEDGCSVYVLDISSQISMFAEGVILSLARSRSLGKFTLELAKWVLDEFAHHMVLVFPQSEAAKLRLSTDLARIELAVEALCPARLLGQSFQSLRGLRAAILLPTETLGNADDELVAQLRMVAPSMVAHLLLGRSSQDSLKHPHRTQGITAGQYVSWLRKHSEVEAWAAVEDSLAAYKKSQAGDSTLSCTEYDAIQQLCYRIRQSE
eukprot:GFKZ01002139.1.p1 GENE.GFKZ01002139.1~~GFKZ01002139.1.p1  ORF type:complete len:823 (-),score=110.77 GFKZ01002139.1:291-2705(-)